MTGINFYRQLQLRRKNSYHFQSQIIADGKLVVFNIITAFYAFFWVVPRCLNFICRRFGTLFHLHTQVGTKKFDVQGL